MNNILRLLDEANASIQENEKQFKKRQEELTLYKEYLLILLKQSKAEVVK